jgi:hypothetical protein
MLKAGNMTLSAEVTYRLATVLIWMGVLAWVPFLFLRIIGETPPFWWFLPFHLLGVVGGVRLRSLARKQMETVPERKSPFTIAGHVLIWTGVLVWPPYFFMKYVQGASVEVMNFLPFHLSGVLGGLLLLGVGFLRNKKKGESTF